MRKNEISRKTRETDIQLTLGLDGAVDGQIKTGCGFFDHMMTIFTYHSGFGLSITCRGDVEVDYHHTVEDIGIALGDALAAALGDKAGIYRYGDAIIPMDEALVLSAVDISGRGAAYLDLPGMSARVGDFDTELIAEFFTALARRSGITLHIRALSGTNTHHIIEGAFKSIARALRQAAAINPASNGEIPSSKGII